jgi:hypothetical protein
MRSGQHSEPGTWTILDPEATKKDHLPAILMFTREVLTNDDQIEVKHLVN